jgi:hypothetical protein
MFNDEEARVKNLRGVRRRPNLRPQFLQDWEMLAEHFFGEA